MNKKYKEFHIRATPFIPELISGILWELKFNGLSEEADFIRAFADRNSVTLSMLNKLLGKLVSEKVISDYSVEEIELENKNWNEEWEKNININEVTERIVIKPSFRNYESRHGQIVITIDPKMSFGTGEHQTTKLMLKLIEKYMRPGMKILDVGSGTAVLAITAVKLGASRAIAVDNDEVCCENALDNCRINNIADSVDVRIGEIGSIPENDFDLILANIHKSILLDIPEEIRKRLKRDGFVILSGLLNNDEDDINSCYGKFRFSVIEKARMDEWIAIVMQLQE